MKRKTYSVAGLMEWVCNIPVGKATMKVTFTGGVLSSYGVTPAKFTTTNTIVQHAIEHSAFFRKDGTGKIKLDKEIEIGGEDPAMAAVNAKRKAETEAASQDGVIGSETTGGTNGHDIPKRQSVNAEENGGEAANPAVDSGEVSTGERQDAAPEGNKTVEVSCVADAVEYLNVNFGITKHNLKSKAQVNEAAMQNNITFVGL